MAEGLQSAATSHAEVFLTHLDEAFRRFGAAHGLPEQLREAVRATPRHRFVHRFRVGKDGPLHDFDEDPIGLLPLIYKGHSLTHVDADGAPLASTNSEAAYVLWLVSRLGIEPGHRVLEIGSGSGWLLAIMAHLAGPDGFATGVEIIADLADQARTDLASLGRSNTNVITADATIAPIPGGLFDRVIIMAATWDLPDALFSLVVDGGHLLVPLQLPRDEGCEVTLLRRDGNRFSTLWTYPGSFVPLVGAGQRPEIARLCFDDPAFHAATGQEPIFSYPLWFGSFNQRQHAPAALAFRRYLALTEPSFAVFERDGTDPHRTRWSSDFGLHDANNGSTAVVRSGVLIGYGTGTAAKRLLHAYHRWCELGMPGPASYTLEVRPNAQGVLTEQSFLTEWRGDSTLVRQMDPQAGAWRSLLDEPDEDVG